MFVSEKSMSKDKGQLWSCSEGRLMKINFFSFRKVFLNSVDSLPPPFFNQIDIFENKIDI